ncbi:MAG: hypothetical protein WBA45_12325 [Microthrixaceae bacterium]
MSEEQAASVRRLLGVDLGFVGDDAMAELMVFQGATSRAELGDRLRAEVETEVARMCELVRGSDAYDVVELLRLREFPPGDTAPESEHDGSGAVIELVALVLLARGRRAEPGLVREDSRPHEVIQELHDRAKRLLRLSSYRLLFAARLEDRQVLARLAATYQSFFVDVRAHQYTSVQAKHDEALFARADTSELLSNHLGFTYEDFVAVRDTADRLYGDAMTAAVDATTPIVAAASGAGDPTEDELDAARQGMIDFIFLPGARAAFTASDVATATGLPIETVEVVLRSFSTGFEQGVPADAAMAFLNGRNPLRTAGLVCDGSEYVMTSGPIGAEAFRLVAEDALKADQKAWTRYDKKIRSVVSEELAVAALEGVLGSEALLAPILYVAPKADGDVAQLHSGCPNPLQVGDLVEGDGLFVIGDVAVCVEVKGRTIAEAARRGDLKRLERETKEVFGVGAGQARRLEQLIVDNGGVWREDATWLDLSDIREVHTVVVGLDTFGPLSVALGDLDTANLLGDGTPPWLASLHDLEVITSVLDRPSEFLLYLRRRTEAGVASNYRAVDELDLFMLFMGGALYVEPDPDETFRAHPRTSRPTAEDRHRREEHAQPTFVGTHTDDLDRWMYGVEGSAPEAPKPTFNIDESTARLVDLLARVEAPGWFRVGADLLNLSGDAQQKVTGYFDELLEASRVDGVYHEFVTGFPGCYGYPTLFAAVTPRGGSADEAGERLSLYMAAKKHQLQSDRSLGLLFNPSGTLSAAFYFNDLPGESAELDEVGARIGLQETWKKRAPTKPTARGRKKKAAKRKKRPRRA